MSDTNSMTHIVATVKLIGCQWVSITSIHTLIGRLQC